jgi:hypothetical protein
MHVVNHGACCLVGDDLIAIICKPPPPPVIRDGGHRCNAARECCIEVSPIGVLQHCMWVISQPISYSAVDHIVLGRKPRKIFERPGQVPCVISMQHMP